MSYDLDPKTVLTVLVLVVAWAIVKRLPWRRIAVVPLAWAGVLFLVFPMWVLGHVHDFLGRRRAALGRFLLGWTEDE